jgi:hypothetical protein
VPGIAPTPVLLGQYPCNHTDDLATQQSQCFTTFTKISGTSSPALTALMLAFLKLGQSAMQANANATLAASALEPRNFMCQEKTTMPDNGLPFDTCGIHPVFRRVNVLPDEIEFVLAETVADPARFALYTAFGALAGAPLCGQPIMRCQTPGEGCAIPLVQHGVKSQSTPDPMVGACGACP